MFQDKYTKLPDSLKEEILQDAIANTPYHAAKQFCDIAGMGVPRLIVRIKKELVRNGYKSEDKKEVKEEKEDKERSLTKSEKALLKSFKEGSVDIQEVSRVVATKVFEKMLKNPDDFKYADFIKTELVKIKQQETADKGNWAMELMNRMFAGKLPPRTCPKCGYELFERYKSGLREPNKILEAVTEEIPDEPIESPGAPEVL